jgi:hypothetical protein
MTSVTFIAPIATGVHIAQHRRQCAAPRPVRLAGKLQRSPITSIPSLSQSKRRLTTVMAAGE